jgi:hypothetical protein
MTPARTIEVRRDAISRTRAVTEADPHTADGQAVLRVERFSLSANNLTYARLGDEPGYWRFFPAADGWGRLPVWAYAEVTASNCAGASVGRRLLGFFPMSDCLVMTPARVHPAGFAAGCEHRRELPGLYNACRWLDADPSYDPALAGQQLVLRPSFWLSFLFDEHLRDNHDFGADIAIISSASSKAALGIAHLLAQRVLTIGLTAPQRVEPLRALRIYDRVEAYDAASGLPAEPAIFADLAGDTGLRAATSEISAADPDVVVAPFGEPPRAVITRGTTVQVTDVTTGVFQPRHEPGVRSAATRRPCTGYGRGLVLTRQAGARPATEHAGAVPPLMPGTCPRWPGLAGHFALRPPSAAGLPQPAETACARCADRVWH